MFCAYMTLYLAFSSNDFLKIKVYCVRFIVDSIYQIKNRFHQLQNEDMIQLMDMGVHFFHRNYVYYRRFYFKECKELHLLCHPHN